MRTNIVLDDDLVAAALRHSGLKTKREVVDLALREFVESRSRRDIRELRGRDLISSSYDHRALREGMQLYLVDTSVWISYMRDEDTAATALFEEIQADGLPFGIAAQIYQEILQGAASPEKFDYLAQFMGSQRFYHPRNPTETYREAARLYFDCRRLGITIRSTIDCLIARIAIENELAILHDDRDFERLAEVHPEIILARR